MGASHIKDQNIQIFMSTNKQYYISGQYVQGQIYLRVKQQSIYNQLILGIDGQQHIYWSQGSGNSRRYYRNTYKNYNSYFTVFNFYGKVKKGDYIFPYSFLLPAMITGSFFHSKHCFLKYTLKTQLIHPSQPKRNQFYSMFLNILQPPRMPITPITKTQTTNSKCCHCCKNYGHVSATLNCDRNFIFNGDTIHVSGMIDNTRNTQIIKSSRVMFQRRRCMISSGGRVKIDILDNVQLYKIGQIQTKDTKNFNFTSIIPQNYVHCTAIGKIVSMYYIIKLYTDYGCCANTGYVELHMIFHSRTPMIVRPQQLPQPPNWYPQVMEKVVYMNMSPYLYNPDPKLPEVNLQVGLIGVGGGMGQVGNVGMIAMNQNTNNNGNDTTRTQNLYPNLNNTGMIQQTWNNNNNNKNGNGYKPVFYDDQMINDAQRQYLSNQGGSTGQQNQIYKKL